MPNDARFVPFGRVGRPHGLRGECRLFLFHPASPLTPALANTAGLRLVAPGRDPVPCRVTSVRGSAAEFAIVQFDTILSRDAIAEWTHAILEVPSHVFPPLDDGEFYAWQLAGLTLVDEDGEPVGEVIEWADFGGGDLLAIRYRGREEFVPFAEPWIGDVDLERRTIVFRPLDLFDDEERQPKGQRGRGEPS
jgi:16S rRNA processing protein RimM